MIDMFKRHEIQVLRRAEHTWSERYPSTVAHGGFDLGVIARSCGLAHDRLSIDMRGAPATP
jgi:hypothetical protein